MMTASIPVSAVSQRYFQQPALLTSTKGWHFLQQAGRAVVTKNLSHSEGSSGSRIDNGK
jgi:hypothetical protein